MAKIKRIEKARKAHTCSKCRKEIKIGDPYLTATPYNRAPIIRCVECGLRSWETSGSEYVQSMGELVEDWQENYGIDENTVDSIKDALEEIKDGCQDSLDNMPEQLQYSPTGEMLQERIDTIDGVISELDSIDLQQMIDDYNADNEDGDECELCDDVLPDDVKDDFIAAVDEALSGIEY